MDNIKNISMSCNPPIQGELRPEHKMSTTNHDMLNT